MSGNRKGKWQRRSESERRSLLARFGASGLSVEAFCQREAISTASFYRWQGVLGGDGERGVGVGKLSAPVFIDAGTLSSAPARRARVELKLDLGEGLVLQLVRS